MPTPQKKTRGGARVVPRFRKGMTRTILTNFRFERALRAQDIADAAKVSVLIVNRLERGGTKKVAAGGKVARNHPKVPALAKAYGVDVEALAPFLGAPSKRYGDDTADTIAPGKRVAVVKAKAPTVTTTPKRAYNKLTRVPRPVREFVRGMVSDLNVRIMEGQKEYIVPPMPMTVFRDFLGDYLKAKGIDATLLLDPHFAEHFD